MKEKNYLKKQNKAVEKRGWSHAKWKKKPVNDKKTLNNLLVRVKEGDTILFLIDRGGTTIFMTLSVKNYK